MLSTRLWTMAIKLPPANSARLLCTQLIDTSASGKMSLSQRLKREPIRRDIMELIEDQGLGMRRRTRKLSKQDMVEVAEERREQKARTSESNVLARMGLKQATNTADELPPRPLAEIAFAGRSNVGKSSLLNALTGKISNHKGTIGLASVANRPGVTRSLNFYSNPMGAQLVDLPGYGFAQASEEEMERWQSAMRTYLAKRGHGGASEGQGEAGGQSDFLRVILVIDARQAMKQTDRDFLLWLDREAGVPLHVVRAHCAVPQGIREHAITPPSCASSQGALIRLFDPNPAAAHPCRRPSLPPPIPAAAHPLCVCVPSPHRQVMSKCDLVKPKDLCRRYTLLESELRALSLRHHVAPHHMVSSKTGAGVDLLRAALTLRMPQAVLRKMGVERARAMRQRLKDDERRELRILDEEVATPAAREFAVQAREKRRKRERSAQFEAARGQARPSPLHLQREKQRAVATDFWARRVKARARAPRSTGRPR